MSKIDNWEVVDDDKTSRRAAPSLAGWLTVLLALVLLPLLWFLGVLALLGLAGLAVLLLVAAQVRRWFRASRQKPGHD